MKARTKRSPIWTIPKQTLINYVSSANSFSDILRLLGMNNKGGNVRTLKQRLQCDGIDYTQVKHRTYSCRVYKRDKIPLELVLVENSTYSRHSLKQRLLKEGLLENVCSVCGQPPIWNNKPLVLELDHINGVFNDNRLANLRIICGHCHSQTPTYAGRRNKKQKIKKPRKSRSEKRPPRELLEQLVWNEPTTKIAARYGVSDKAVEKWCKFYGINKPSRGYWARKYSGVV